MLTFSWVIEEGGMVMGGRTDWILDVTKLSLTSDVRRELLPCRRTCQLEGSRPGAWSTYDRLVADNAYPDYATLLVQIDTEKGSCDMDVPVAIVHYVGGVWKVTTKALRIILCRFRCSLHAPLRFNTPQPRARAATAMALLLFDLGLVPCFDMTIAVALR